MQTIEKTDIPGIVRKEGALINTDATSLEAYKARKKQARKMSDLERKVETLMKEVDDLKNIINKLR